MTPKQTFEAVPVSEALPEKSGFYYVKMSDDSGKSSSHGFWWNGKDWCFDNMCDCGEELFTAGFGVDVTHWLRPSPSPIEITQGMIEAEAEKARTLFDGTDMAHRAMIKLEQQAFKDGFKRALELLSGVSEQEEKSLLREVSMRANIAFPENEQDEKWFNEKFAHTKVGDLMQRLFKELDLGKVNS